MGDWLECGNSLHNFLVDSLVVIVAVTAVFNIVHIISSLLAEQAVTLRTRDVESLLAARLVALHARPMLSAGLPPGLLAEVAHLIVSFLWH